MKENHQNGNKTMPAFLLPAGIGLCACMCALSTISGAFAYDMEDLEKPILGAVAIMITAAGLYIYFILRNKVLPISLRGLYLILFFGLIMRLSLIVSTPVLEDDHFRYLWDGGVTAAGYNPYARSPTEILNNAEGSPEKLRALAKQAYPIAERINYPYLKSIYPPLTQLFFALAHLISPWSLVSWRIILLFADVLTLLLLLSLIRAYDIPLISIAIYWLNPLLVKEIYNSAHMDVMLFPFMIGAVLSAQRGRHILSSGLIGCAGAIKFWPLILLPVVTRPLIRKPWSLACSIGLCLFLTGLFLVPYYVGGLDESSGLIAYGMKWQMNDSAFMLILWPLRCLFRELGAGSAPAQSAARITVALVLVSWTLYLCKSDTQDIHGINRRFLFVISGLFLLSPTQYPWYATWIVPFLVLEPRLSLLSLTLLLPLYYLRFYLDARGMAVLHDNLVVWFEFVPVWVLLLWERLRQKKRARFIKSGAPYGRVETISVIIPCLDEERQIDECLGSLLDRNGVSDVILADGGSRDGTLEKADRYNVNLIQTTKGRGLQIAEGIKRATGDAILILHADCSLERGSVGRVLSALNGNRFAAGGALGMRFKAGGIANLLIGFLNNLRARSCGISFGDQGQFFRREILPLIGGFPPLMLMEDVELSIRLKGRGDLLFLGKGVRASARRWEKRPFFLNIFTVLTLFTKYLFERKRHPDIPCGINYYEDYYGKKGSQ